MKIKEIHGRQIIDSRGNPTVEADVVLENGVWARAAVPSGASKGTHEALELRDGDPAVYDGKSVLKAVGHINGEIAEALKGKEAKEQTAIDMQMVELDGTLNKSRLGANAILAVSLATAKAAAAGEGMPLYQYVAGLAGKKEAYLLPLPLMNIVNGGKHARGTIEIQEFMILPVGAESFAEAVEMGANVFHALARILGEKGYGTSLGDEGGYVPHAKGGNREIFQLIGEAVKHARYDLGQDIVFGLDVAASELFEDGVYNLRSEGKKLNGLEMNQWIKELAKEFPIVSIEDPLREDDWADWKALTKELGESTQIVGDDLLVTNTTFLTKAIEEKAANAILLKPNQVGTLTETINAFLMAEKAGWRTVISHRSGETEDTTIAHLAVGLGAGQIKTGSLARTDRVAKYNELLRIEEQLGDKARFGIPHLFAY